MREILSFAFTLAGIGMLVGIAGNDDLSVIQGVSNTVENIMMPIGCLGLGWLIGGKQ